VLHVYPPKVDIPSALNPLGTPKANLGQCNFAILQNNLFFHLYFIISKRNNKIKGGVQGDITYGATLLGAHRAP